MKGISPPPSKFVQIVDNRSGNLKTSAINIPYDDTIPQIGEGIDIEAVTITPKRATNVLKITCLCCVGQSTGTVDHVTMALFRVGTADALDAVTVTTHAVNCHDILSLIHYEVAGVITPTVFKFRVGGDSTAVNVCGKANTRAMGGKMFSSITIEEYRP